MKYTLLLPFCLSFTMLGCQQTSYSYSSSSTEISESPKQQILPEEIIFNLAPWNDIQTSSILDLPDNHRILNQRKRFLSHKESFYEQIRNSEPYIGEVVKQIKERGMPIELVLLPLLESHYQINAKSPKNAAGLWQIMPQTAKWLNLEYNSHYDGRLDLIDSTKTALDLLSYLNQQFDGDWLLTLAAYNAGEGRVKNAIKENRARSFDTNFWALTLPQETMTYVPRFLALVDLVRNDTQYGIDLPELSSEYALIPFKVKQEIALKQLSHLTHMDLKELSQYNLAHLDQIIRPDSIIYLPANQSRKTFSKLHNDDLIETTEKVSNLHQTSSIRQKALAQNPANAQLFYKTVDDAKVRFYLKQQLDARTVHYKVKSGDTLSTIAARHKVTLANLMKWNKITKPHLIKAGQNLVIYL